MFVDELARFAADVRDPRCAAIAERLATPLRVAVSGRHGVGRSTAAHALTHAGTPVVTTPDHADLVIYVLAEVVKPEDRAAIEAATRPVLTVLTKADLVATTAPGRHPRGPSDAARARCEQLSARTGLTIRPLVGLLAVCALDDEVWAGLQALAGGCPVAAQVRRRLVEVLDVFGMAQAIAVIRDGATRPETVALLRRLSCIDEIVDAIEVLGAALRYHRVLDAIADLETLAVTDPRISDFLNRDDTVVARMMAAVEALEASGMTVDHGDTADAHMRRAVHWRRAHTVAGSDIARGSLRLWAEVGGTV